MLKLLKEIYMSDIKDKIKSTVLESRLCRDFSTLATELLKKQNARADAFESTNKIINEEVEELAQQISLLIESSS